MAEIAHYKEMHPLAFRITHWVNLVAMILLILSGVFPSRLMTVLAFGFILAGTLWLYVYSWLVYRKQSGS